MIIGGKRLTPREVEILALMAKGLTAVEVGAKLGITGRTVEQHTYIIRRKIGAKTSVQAVAMFVEQRMRGGQ